MKRDRDREREKRERERGRETEKKSVCVYRKQCPQLDLVDWKENHLFNTLFMQNLYIVN